MKFEKALEFLKEGKRIRRKEDCGWVSLNNGDLLRYELSSSRIGELVRGNASFSLADVLADDWEVIETKKEKTWWKPKVGESYWSIRPWSGAVRVCYNDHKVDGFAVSMGLCFQTEEQADFMVEKLKVIYELEKFAYENNDEEIDWNNQDQRKYYLILTCTGGKKRYMNATYSFEVRSVPFNVYFTSEELARKAIATIGAERIKKYYFGVE